MLVLSYPGKGQLKVPLASEGHELEASVWEWTGKVLDEGEEASKWLSDILGTQCRLVRKMKEEKRMTDEKYTLNFESQTSFSDGYPYTIACMDSLGALNDSSGLSLPMNRFRANIICDGGGQPFQEDL